MTGDTKPRDHVEVRVRDAVADLVTVLVIVRRADGTHYTGGLLSLPLDDWHRTVKPMWTAAGAAVPGSVRMDDDTRPDCRR